MKTILVAKNNLPFIVSALLFAGLLTFTGCTKDDPQKEDSPELITKATLTFTPSAGGTPIIVSATDPDGDGVQDIAADGPINLAISQTYTMEMSLTNELAIPGEPGYNLTDEIKAEGNEHIFFFEWTNDIFSIPIGNGNVDFRSDDIRYNDVDSNNLPIGLSTTWTTQTTAVLKTGTFRIVLKHQPGLKTTTSESTVGETDLDVQFMVNVQ